MLHIISRCQMESMEDAVCICSSGPLVDSPEIKFQLRVGMVPDTLLLTTTVLDPPYASQIS